MSSGSFLTPGSWLSVGPPTPPPPPDIRVNDISVNSQGKDGSTNGGMPSPESAKRQWRRSSWCPEQERKKEEKQEIQKSLAVAGRRLFSAYFQRVFVGIHNVNYKQLLLLLLVLLLLVMIMMMMMMMMMMIRRRRRRRRRKRLIKLVKLKEKNPQFGELTLSNTIWY